jgi:hypothetical protein
MTIHLDDHVLTGSNGSLRSNFSKKWPEFGAVLQGVKA